MLDHMSDCNMVPFQIYCSENLNKRHKRKAIGQMTNAIMMLSESKQTMTQVCQSLGSWLWSIFECLDFFLGFFFPNHFGRDWITFENAEINGLF